MEFIHSLKGAVFILTGKLAVNHFLSNSFKEKVPSSYVFFQRYCYYFYRMLSAIDSFKGIIHFSDVKIWSHQVSPDALSFSVFQNTNHLESNFLSKQLYFQSSIDYIEMRAATWSSYFFVERFFSEYQVFYCCYFFLITTSW